MADRRLKNIFEYLMFLPLAALFRTLPRRLALRTGEQIGRIVPFIMPKRQKTAMENLRHAYPEKAEEELSNICAKMFRHLGISAAEMIRLDKLNGQKDLERYFKIEGLENLEKAKAMDRGVFIATGHLGFWEVGAFFMPLVGLPLDGVAKKAKNPYIDRYFHRMRTHTGCGVIDAKQGARKVVKSLASKRAVGVLIDHHMTPKVSVQVPFFGRLAWTTPIITQIAMKRNIPVIPIFFFRTEDLNYRVEIGEIIMFENEVTDENITANTALLTEKIEAAVRKEPSQWFWVHRRWRVS
jgi:KDO2-lipid IV(A) lauroyltransferase